MQTIKPKLFQFLVHDLLSWVALSLTSKWMRLALNETILCKGSTKVIHTRNQVVSIGFSGVSVRFVNYGYEKEGTQSTIYMTGQMWMQTQISSPLQSIIYPPVKHIMYLCAYLRPIRVSAIPAAPIHETITAAHRIFELLTQSVRDVYDLNIFPSGMLVEWEPNYVIKFPDGEYFGDGKFPIVFAFDSKVYLRFCTVSAHELVRRLPQLGGKIWSAVIMQ